MISPEELMRSAIAKAREGIDSGQSPFGCAIAQGDLLVANCHNVVWDATDITAHAEITALREACRNTSRIHLPDCIVATTCEPCPMCMSALHWARVTRVYFGASISDAVEAGFNELALPADTLLRLGGSSVKLISGILRNECVELFHEWRNSGGQAY